MFYNEKITLPDKNQNFWQMASIQSAAFGVPVLYFGADLGKHYGSLLAILSICIGNLLLWLIGLAIVAMTVKSRKSAIENLIPYIGKYGCLLGGFTLSVAFLFWYPIQIKEAVAAVRTTLESYTDLSQNFDIRIGTFLGLTMALLAIGGIRLIKWLTVISFPFLIIFIIYAVIKNTSPPRLTAITEISLAKIISPVLASVSITLAGIVNLPTFFRHRRSEIDAYFALSIFVFFTALIECLAVFLINTQTGEFFIEYLNINLFSTIIIISFLIIAMICVNLTNIYFASAVWEIIFPWVSRSRELALIGMAGTVTFVFFQAQEVMTYLESLFTTFIGILGIVLIVGYEVKKIVEHRERKFELVINTICWLIGCFVAIIIQDIKLVHSARAFFAGIWVSFLLLVLVLFFEETVWALKKIIYRKI